MEGLTLGQEMDTQIDIMHSLENYLDAYADHAEMVVTEAIGNAIDVGASRIDINLKMDMHGDASISFYNNGPGMTLKQFKDYQVISRSSKTKGKGIGFAGVGAKVYLAAWPEKTKIHTETSDGSTSFASYMYIRNGKVKHVYVKPEIKKAGTLYEVKLKDEDYQKLAHGTHHIIEDGIHARAPERTQDTREQNRRKTVGAGSRLQEIVRHHSKGQEVQGYRGSQQGRHAVHETVFPIPRVREDNNVQEARLARRD